jgi:hypothetical protein
VGSRRLFSGTDSRIRDYVQQYSGVRRRERESIRLRQGYGAIRKALTRQPNPGFICAMKFKTTLVFLAVWVAGGSLCFGSAFDGTWKLNVKKSHLLRGMGRNETVKYEMAFPFRTRVTVDGVDAKGKATHNVWVGMFNGTDYSVTGDPEADTRSYNKVDDHTLNFWQKKGGKVTISGKIVVAPDGKTRTVTVTAPGRKGKMVRTSAVYDKA